LVPLVPRTVYSLDDLVGSAATVLVRNMPMFAWVAADLLVRVEANALAPGAHTCTVEVIRSAPDAESPGEDFDGGVTATIAVTSAEAAGTLLLDGLDAPWPPYADLAITVACIAGVATPGNVTLSIAMLVRGQPRDRIAPMINRGFGPAPGAP
jgi:hypothetical protein